MKKLLLLFLLIPSLSMGQVLESVEFTRHGYYKVIVEDTLYSQHTTQKECLEQSTNLLLKGIDSECEPPVVSVVGKFGDTPIDTTFIYDTTSVESLTLRNVNMGFHKMDGTRYLTYKVESRGDSVQFQYYRGATLLRREVKTPQGGVAYDTLRAPPVDSIDVTVRGYWGKWVESYREIVNIAFLDTIGQETMPASGSGTEADPYILTTGAHLNEISDDTGAWYELGNDIDASGITWTQSDFNGRLNGAGFTVSNLDTGSGAMFNLINGFGAPSSLAIIHDITFSSCSSSGQALLGFEVRNAVEIMRVKFDNCTINPGDVSVVGGVIAQIFGTNGDLTISEVSVINSDIDGRNDIGGIIGRSENVLSMSNCKVENTTITANGGVQRASGLVDDTATGNTIDKCFSSATVSGQEENGISGDNNATITNTFWDTTVGPSSTSGGGTGKTTSEMQDVATYTDTTTTGLTNPWDFVGNPNNDSANNDYWDIDSGYPFLTAFDTGSGATALSGSIDSSFTLSGNTIEEATLSGDITNESTISGNIIQQAALSGNIPVESNLSGNLIQQAVLSGELQAASELASAVVKQMALSGQIDSESSLSASLVKQALLSGSIDAQSALSGNIIIVDEGVTSLSGSISTESSLSGNLTATKHIQGIIESETELSGDVIKQVSLSGNLITVSSLSSDASIQKALAGTLLVSSSISGELTPVGAAWGGTIDITNSPLYSISFEVKPMHKISIQDDPLYTINIKVKDE